MNPSLIEIAGTVIFAFAVMHTFLVKRFQTLASRYPEGSAGENFFHLLGEIEVVFGIWAAVFIVFIAVTTGHHQAIEFVQEKNFTEPLFVFVIMSVCSTKPILELATSLIRIVSKAIPGKGLSSFYFVALTLGCWLGSFITEPAAMTVVALVLFNQIYPSASLPLKYATLGLLFVNVSIGGTLTPFAAPPVLMVAEKWNWDLQFMAINFGWKGMLSSLLSAALVVFKFRNELSSMQWTPPPTIMKIPLWVYLIHLFFLILIVLTAHYSSVFVGCFLFFLGVVTVTKEYQSPLQLKSGMLVGFFLAGLVVLGGPQRWWLEPILMELSAFPLYLASLSLTAITDNAALTYLGSQVPGLSAASKYALVSGAVVGGGLTVIANAPNPAGFGILNPAFGKEGISPLKLFLSALPPTMIAAIIYWIF